MSYSDFYIQKRGGVPVWMGFVVAAIAAVLMGQYLFTNNVPAPQASQKKVTNHTVTNLSPSQATIVWETVEKSRGWVIYGESATALGSIALDERDSENKKNDTTFHHVTLKNLKSNTQYFYKLVVGSQVIAGESGKAFNVNTLGKSFEVSRLEPAYGKVLNNNGNPAEGTLLMLTIPGAHPLSTLSKPSGEWLIPLNYIVDEKSGRARTLDSDDEVHLTARSKEGSSSPIRALVSTIRPLPQDIIVGKSYDFTTPTDVLSVNTTTQQMKNYVIAIQFPQSGATVPSPTALIKGKAYPVQSVRIVLARDNQALLTATVTSDRDGSWSYNAPSLPNGSYSLTINTPDASGSTVTKKASFSIAKSGERVLAAATDSASTATPSPSPSPTPSEILTTTPTSSPSAAPVSGFSVAPLGLIGGALFLLGIAVLVAF